MCVCVCVCVYVRVRILFELIALQLTPAESRELNHECLLLGYYDSHDIWHFLSATALLVSFLVSYCYMVKVVKSTAF